MIKIGNVHDYKMITSGGIIANARAAIVTTGVYFLANLVIKFSVGAFLLLAFCTKSSIFETVDSPKLEMEKR